MSTELQWFVFKIPFRLYDQIIPFPFKWEPTQKRLSPSVPLNAVSRKLIAWIWVGPILFGINCMLFTIQFRILLNLQADQRLGLAFYIRLLAVIIQLFLFATISQFSSYYTKNRVEMAALFTGSLELMESPLDLLGAWYLINTKPFYKDFLGGALAGVTFVIGFLLMTVPALGIFFDFDSLAPLLPTSFSNINTTFDMIEFLIRVLVRVSFYTVTCVLTARWFNFMLVHVAVVLEIWNSGLILIRKYIHLPPPPYRDHLKRNQWAWEKLLIRVVLIHREFLLITQMWSQNIGHIIFTMYSVGIMILCISNFCVISLGSKFGIELNALLIGLSLICMTMFMILVSFVSSIAVNSKKIILDIVQMLNGYKVGKRYSRTMRYAKISTPYFSFTGTNYFFLLGIPLEMTLNLSLTFSAKVQQSS
ncbi:unnamed protein product [Orchesella dallaii]|uniref:Gustatory receptor n=1 Tax=Orchesella dallaii TaxID=48710 RepID=A0ABP1QGG8_9HEXA